MSYGGLGSGFGIPQLKRRRIFTSYHHRGDQQYYEMFSKAFHDTYESIYDNSLERQIDSDDVDYVMRKIRENYITGTSCTIVLVGNETWGRKYVDWEIKATLDKQHGLIGVQLPTAPRTAEGKIPVPARLLDNIQSGFALWRSWQDITSSAEQLRQYVADASSRNPLLIANSRELRLKNA
jgi:MTH538 TIR-like domain (DUF1863)